MSVLQAVITVLQLAKREPSCDAPPDSLSATDSPPRVGGGGDSGSGGVGGCGKGERAASTEPKGGDRRRSKGDVSASKSTSNAPPEGADEEVLLTTELPDKQWMGSSRCGSTWRAKVHGEDAVIKVVDVDQQPELQEELAHEVAMYEALRELQGRVVPRLLFHGWLWEGSLRGLATSYVGPSLADCPQPLSERVQASALQALSSLHERGVLHGDIRLENFVVRGASLVGTETTSPRVFVIDLGLSRVVRPELGKHGGVSDAERAKLLMLLGAEGV